VSEIREYSGGNPLFIEELCHSAAHDHAGHRASRTLGEAWPDKLIEARVERLPPAQTELVRTAAVIGNVIPAPVLESITGCRADDPLVLALAEQDLIYPGEQPATLRFKHGIARDVIYAAVGLRERRAMHLRIAETLRQQASSGLGEEFYEALAYHYGACGEARQAARYAELAGDKAMAASALDRAQVQYGAALAAIDLTEPTGSNYQRWMQIAQRLALACVFDPSWEQLEILLRALDLARAHGDQQATACAEYWVGYNYYALGESGRAIKYLQPALESALRIGDAPLVRRVRATLGQAHAAACNYDEAIALLDEAIEVRRRRERTNRLGVGFAYTLACKASVLGDRGRFNEAHQCFEEALAAVCGAGHEVEGSVLCWRSGVLLWQGRWEEARQCARDAQAVAERVKSVYLYAMSVSLGAYAACSTEATGASLQTIVDATSWIEKRARGLFISLNYGWLAEGMVACRNWQAARRYAARALMRSRNHDRIGGAMAYRAMARASAAGQNRKPAELYLALATDTARARGSPHELALTQLCDAEIRLARGQRSQAAALLDEAASAFEGMAMTWHLEATRRMRAAL
jgi:tetratricopeptide (TPR) repeat protein